MIRLILAWSICAFGFIYVAIRYCEARDVQSAAEISRQPDRFAWAVFAEINQPKKDDSVAWEHWALARKVYGDPDLVIDPNDEQKLRKTFAAMARPDRGPAGRFDGGGLIQQQLFERQQRLERFLDDPHQFLERAGASRARLEADGAAQRFDPHVRPQIPADRRENDEVRMNFETFEFLMQKELYNIEGQEAMFARRELVDFPVESKEIKAAWRRLDEKDNPKEFHTHILKAEDGSRETWGLIALHITTKDLPNWVWATWEHKSNVQREMVVLSRDRSGLVVKNGVWASSNAEDDQLADLVAKLNRLPQKWTNYVLRGTQVDFVDATGNPTILANSIIEEGFQDSSSCITCHARAARGPRKRRSEEGNMLAVFAGNDPPSGHVGTPDRNWFVSDTSPPGIRFWQMDFVWSTIRARRKGTLKQPLQHPLSGTWSYRAFLNDPDSSASPEKLLLGKGRLRIANVDAEGRFEGRLEIDDTDPPQPLKITGEFKRGESLLITFDGEGSGSTNRDWKYRYRGYLFPDDLRATVTEGPPKPELGQLRIMTGQIIRVKDHPGEDGAVHPAGQMGTWYLVKQRNETTEEDSH